MIKRFGCSYKKFSCSLWNVFAQTIKKQTTKKIKQKKTSIRIRKTKGNEKRKCL